MPAKPEFHTLAEFRKLSGNFKKPVVIYFNKTQLANLNSSAKPGTGKVPTKGVTLTVSEVAGFDGGFVTPNCPETPTKIGSGELRCGSAPSIPSGPGSPEIQLRLAFSSSARTEALVVRADAHAEIARSGVGVCRDRTSSSTRARAGDVVSELLSC